MITVADIRKQIWELSGQNVKVISKASGSVKITPGTVQYWSAVLRNVEELTHPAKRKKKTERLTKEQYDRYAAAHHRWFLIHRPNVCKDGFYLPPENPIVSTDSGFKSFIRDYLTWEGHFANITQNKGFAKTKTAPRAAGNGKVQQIVTGTTWIPSTGKNGMQDIDANLKHPAHQYGIPWKIECKTKNDKHSDHQSEFGKLVQQTGGVWSEVWSVEDFYRQYDQLTLS
jgi:hypothetical protein